MGTGLNDTIIQFLQPTARKDGGNETGSGPRKLNVELQIPQTNDGDYHCAILTHLNSMLLTQAERLQGVTLQMREVVGSRCGFLSRDLQPDQSIDAFSVVRMRGLCRLLKSNNSVA